MCEEVDDEICAKILKHHGLDKLNDECSSATSLNSDSDDGSTMSNALLSNQVNQGKLTDEQFKEILKVL